MIFCCLKSRVVIPHRGKTLVSVVTISDYSHPQLLGMETGWGGPRLLGHTLLR